MTTSHSKVAPKHYSSKISPLEAIQEWGLGFCLGNTVKYIARCGKKDGETRLDDLEKAMFYLAKEIEYEKDKDIEVDFCEVQLANGDEYRIARGRVDEIDDDAIDVDSQAFREKWGKYKINQ